MSPDPKNTKEEIGAFFVPFVIFVDMIFFPGPELPR